MRKLIRADGTVVDIGRCTIEEIRKTLNAETIDTFALHDRVHVAFVDDNGHHKSLSTNARATALYYLKCGGGVPHSIVGDVIVVPDEDFADDDDAGFSPVPDPDRTAEIERVLTLDVTTELREVDGRSSLALVFGRPQ